MSVKTILTFGLGVVVGKSRSSTSTPMPNRVAQRVVLGGTAIAVGLSAFKKKLTS